MTDCKRELAALGDAKCYGGGLAEEIPHDEEEDSRI